MPAGGRDVIQESQQHQRQNAKAANALQRPRPSRKPNRLFGLLFFLVLAAFTRRFQALFLALGAIGGAFDQLGTDQLQHALLGAVAFARAQAGNAGIAAVALAEAGA